MNPDIRTAGPTDPVAPAASGTAADTRASSPPVAGATGPAGRGGPGIRRPFSWLRAMKATTLLALLLLLAVLPLLLGAYPVGLAGRILAFALLVVSVDLLAGLTGLPSLGQIAYFGIGAYTAGLVGIHVTTNLFLQLAAGVVAGTVAALITGALAVRTSGLVFLMITLAIGELTHRVADGLALVGGSNGLSGIPAGTLYPGGEPLMHVAYKYWWVLAVFLVGVGAAVLVSRSPLGRSMRAVRESPTRLAAVGQRAYTVKLFAYTIAGAVAGAAGTAWTAQTQFVSPGDLAFSVSAIALLSVVLGGAGTIWGPILGAIVVVFVRDWVSGYLAGHGELLLGLLFIVAAYLLPRGIAGARRGRESRRRASDGGVAS
jgi:branched-chain amino acid transport system permease protein